MDLQLIEKKIQLLPNYMKKEALDYINSLIARENQRKKTTCFNFTWEGGLANLKNNFSSVELQHKSIEWR